MRPPGIERAPRPRSAAPRPLCKRSGRTSTCCGRSRPRPSGRGRAAHRRGPGRARPRLHRRQGPGRRGYRQQGRAGGLLRQGRHAAGGPGAAGQRPCRRELQGDAADPSRPGQTVRLAVDALPEHGDRRARSRASRPPRAPCSASCRPRTPPATSPRSSSGCRSASRRPPSRCAEGRLRPGLSVVVDVDTRDRAARRSRDWPSARTGHMGPAAAPQTSCHAPPRQRAGWSPSSSWSSACSWRSWTSRSSRPRCPRSRPACRPARTRSPGSRPAT